jgi:hypothetical protein
MEIVIAVVALALLIAALGAAPMTRRFGDASEEKFKAGMPGNLKADVESGFKRPRDEGDLF